MKKVNQWEDLVGRTVVEVNRSPDTRSTVFILDDYTKVAEFETAEYYDTVMLEFYSNEMDIEAHNQSSLNAIRGKKISGVIVPFIEDGFFVKSYVTIYFADGSELLMCSPDLTTPVRLT